MALPQWHILDRHTKEASKSKRLDFLRLSFQMPPHDL